MSQYQVESRVEIPKQTRNRTSKYPFGIMAVGDSFFAPEATVSTVRSSASNAQLKLSQNGQKVTFTVRSVEEQGYTGVRCWRIE
jgi:hypothetical protein